MKPFITVTDEDIFPKEMIVGKPKSFVSRTAVKIILEDREGKIALVGPKYRLLPGGGVEEGETLDEAVKRECLEETGCEIAVIQNLGFSEEWRYAYDEKREGRHQKAHFFYGKVVGEKGVPQTTQENEKGMQVEWFDKSEVIQFIEEQEKNMSLKSYNSHFNTKTSLAILKKFLSK